MSEARSRNRTRDKRKHLDYLPSSTFDKRDSAWKTGNNWFSSIFSEECVTECTSTRACEQGDDGCICNVGNLNPIYHCLNRQCSEDTANDVLGEVVEWCDMVFKENWGYRPALVTGPASSSSPSQSSTSYGVSSSSPPIPGTSREGLQASQSSGVASSWTSSSPSSAHTSNPQPTWTPELETSSWTPPSSSASSISRNVTSAIPDSSTSAMPANSDSIASSDVSSLPVQQNSVAAPLTIPTASAPPGHDEGLPIGANVGIALATIAACAGIIYLFTFCIRRKRYNQTRGVQLPDSPDTRSNSSWNGSVVGEKTGAIETLRNEQARRAIEASVPKEKTVPPRVLESVGLPRAVSNNASCNSPVPSWLASAYPGSSYQGSLGEQSVPTTPSSKNHKRKPKSLAPSLFHAFPTGPSTVGSPTEAAPTRRNSRDLAWASIKDAPHPYAARG